MARVLSADTVKAIEAACAHYPTRLAAMLPALHLVMDEVGCVTPEAALDVADVLRVPASRVHEAVTFYTMFSTQPPGRHTIKICRNLACALRGAEALIARARDRLGVGVGGTTEDGRITLDTEECLASCGTAPMLWCRSRGRDGTVRERIVENLDEAKLDRLLEELT